MVLHGPDVSGSHLGISAHVVEGLVDFRVGKNKREDDCDVHNASTKKY